LLLLTKRFQPSAPPPRTALVHLALLGTQVIFGLGSVIGKLGVHKFNPFLFVAIRDGSAGPLLMLLSLATAGLRGSKLHLADLPRFVLAGFCLFVSQSGFIVGVKFASAVVGSAWQPAQPIMATTLALALGWEQASAIKIAGILIGFGGAAFMALYGQKLDASSAPLIGNLLFFCNCMGTVIYVMLTKPLLNSKRYSYITVSAWAYLIGACFSVATVFIVNSKAAWLRFFAPDVAMAQAWVVPHSAILPLIYWILFNSVAAYLLITWGNQYAPASTVLAYCPMQPFVSTALVYILILAGPGKTFHLEEPGLNAIGAIPIVIGMLLVAVSARADEEAARRKNNLQQNFLR